MTTNNAVGQSENGIDFDYDDLCLNILYENDDIKYMAILNKKGKSTAEARKQNSPMPLQDRTRKEMLFMETVLLHSLGEQYDDLFGNINYSIIYRSNNCMFSFPLSQDRIVFLIVKNTCDPESIIQKILDNFKTN